MDGTWRHYTKWNKSDGERQIPYNLTYLWNLREKDPSTLRTMWQIKILRYVFNARCITSQSFADYKGYVATAVINSVPNARSVLRGETLHVLITRKQESKQDWKWGLCELIHMLISLIVAIISQCIHVSTHPAVHLKHIQLLSVNYPSVKPSKYAMFLSNYINWSLSQGKIFLKKFNVDSLIIWWLIVYVIAKAFIGWHVFKIFLP